jgi:hypothetical protein
MDERAKERTSTMTYRMLLSAALVTMLAAGGIATAASTPAATHCSALERQFDDAAAAHQANPSLQAAKALREDGAKMCTSGKAPQGVKKLEQALTTLGVKPQL